MSWHPRYCVSGSSSVPVKCWSRADLKLNLCMIERDKQAMRIRLTWQLITISREKRDFIKE